MRIRGLYILACILGGILIVNLFYKQIICFSYWSKLSRKNIIRIIPEPGARGKILDRNNNIIADSKVRFNVAIIPQEAKDKAGLFKKISIILNLPPESLEKKFKKSYLNPFSPVVIAAFISKEDAILLEQQKEDLHGMIIQTDFYRFYPYRDATAHILGYVAAISKERISQLKTYGYTPEAIVGYSGIEEFKDSYLQAEPGGASFEVDSQSRAVRLLGIKPSIAGSDLKLTIDIQMQKICQDMMSGHRGAAVIMDYNTGEVFALVSSPSFDANIFPAEDYQEIKTILNDKDKPMLNRAVSGEYSPGSTFKVVLASAGLQAKQISRKDRVFCSGSISIGNHNFSCWSKHGSQNVLEALANSCNVFFYHLGLKLSIPLIAEYAENFGLSKKTGIDLPYEKEGFIPGVPRHFIREKQRWYGGDVANVSIGQGDVLVTPIQFVRAMAAIANGGELIQPHIIYDKKLPINYVNIKVNKANLTVVQEGLRRAVADETGTASILSMDKLKILGKTGTTQVAGAESHGWFVGYMEKPHWAVCIFLENVGGSYVACRLLRNILSEMINKNIIDAYDK